MTYKEWMEKTDNDDVDIYIGGQYFAGGSKYACYWKNGELFTLSAPTDAVAKSIKICNGDVYISGSHAGPNACYWKNEELTTLSGPDGIVASSTYDLRVMDEDIYISGYYYYGGANQAVYWKNEEINFLPNPGTANTWALGLWILKSRFGQKNIYAAGYCEDGGNRACAWKDNEVVMKETVTSRVNKFLIKNEKIYLCGDYNNNQSCIWTDLSNREILSAATSSLNSIFFNGDDIYYTGFYSSGGDRATYWKNRNRYNIENADDSQARDIYIFDDDIYIVGYHTDEACIWKNGSRTDLQRPVGSSSAEAYGILVVRKKYY